MLAFVALLFAASYVSLDALLDARIDEDLAEDIEEFADLYAEEGLTGVTRMIDRETAGEEAELAFMQLLHADGTRLHASDLGAWAGLAVDRQRLQQALADADEPALATLSLAAQEYPTRTAYGHIGDGIVLWLGESLEEQYAIRELLVQVFALLSVLTVPVVCALGWWMARRATRRVEAVSAAADAIARGELDRRVAVLQDGTEIQGLAEAFNAMAERVSRLMAEMREVNDNITHDLRSPLTRIRVLAESALSNGIEDVRCRELASSTLEECDRLMQMINTTLDIAEVEAGVGNAEREPLDMTELVQDAGELFRPVSEEKHIELNVVAQRDCRMHGNRQDLQRTLANLIDNAIKYTPERGRVSVTLSRDAAGLLLSVADTGIGIAANEQAKIFQRFYRCDRSRSHDGCGLGLSLARAVVRAHGGSLTVSSAADAGSTFSIRLPLPAG